MTPQELIERFELFDDWSERYRYLIELGRKLDPLEDALKTEETKVRGCMSQVWLVSDLEEGPPARLRLRADSDAHITKGLVALLVLLFSGHTAAEILAVDIDDVFSRIGLDKHLSPNRRNGFYAMVERVRGLARAAAA